MGLESHLLETSIQSLEIGGQFSPTFIGVRVPIQPSKDDIDDIGSGRDKAVITEHDFSCRCQDSVLLLICKEHPQ